MTLHSEQFTSKGWGGAKGQVSSPRWHSWTQGLDRPHTRLDNRLRESSLTAMIGLTRSLHRWVPSLAKGIRLANSCSRPLPLTALPLPVWPSLEHSAKFPFSVISENRLFFKEEKCDFHSSVSFLGFLVHLILPRWGRRRIGQPRRPGKSFNVFWGLLICVLQGGSTPHQPYLHQWSD